MGAPGQRELAQGEHARGELAEAIERAHALGELYIEGVHVTGEELDDLPDLEFFEFHDVTLEQCTLRGLRANKASFYDSTLHGCDLSGAQLEEAYFARTRLASCKLEGTQLTKSFWRSSRLLACMCRYANFGEATLERTSLVDCDLREAFLSEMRLKGRTLLEGCNLTRADLFRTSLKGMDLSTCNITGIAVSDTHAELRGMRIAPEQAVDLVGMLGVTIVED